MEENLTQTASQEPVFEITDTARLHLLSISKWMKFFYVFAIIGVVFVGIMGLAYIFAGSILLADEPSAAVLGPVVGIIMLLIDVFVGYVTFCLGKATAFIKVSLPGKDSQKLEVGLEYMKKTLKTYGIFCVAMLCFYAVIIVVAIIAVIIAAIAA